jgi:hypothetical protein
VLLYDDGGRDLALHSYSVIGMSWINHTNSCGVHIECERVTNRTTLGERLGSHMYVIPNLNIAPT